MKRLAEKFGSKANPHMPLSLNVFTLALKSKNGVESKAPFLNTFTTPFFCQMNMRPSGAQATPTGPKVGRVVTNSDTKPASLNDWAEPLSGASHARAAPTSVARGPSTLRLDVRKRLFCALTAVVIVL